MYTIENDLKNMNSIREDKMIIWKIALIVVAIISCILMGTSWHKINQLQEEIEDQKELQQKTIRENSEFKQA